MQRRRTAAALAYALLGLAALSLTAGSARAQPYPSKPIRFVVGFAPGSSTDIVARVVAEQLRQRLGQPVVVDNKPGANGMLAATEVARAAPDGYTVLISNSSTITVNGSVYKKISYDAARDFAPLTMVISAPFLLIVNPDRDAGVRTVADFVKKAKDQPGKLSYGSAGVANLTQLTFELMKDAAGIDVSHVPYKGAAPAQQAVLAREVDAAFDTPSGVPHIKAGKLLGLAVSSAQRWRDLPDVPTMAESGYPGFDLTFWIGALAPAGTPQPVLDRLTEAIRAAAEDATARRQLESQGSLQMLTSAAFQQRIKAETAMYARIIAKRGISLDQ